MTSSLYQFFPSPNFDTRTLKISKIVLHSTECPTTEAALAILTSPYRKVSCHYLICKTGEIYKLVEEENRAWHAGKSAWGDEEDINDISLGIELDHPSPDDRDEEYPCLQIEALLDLLKDLSNRYDIKPHNILAHSDIAPNRKRDPGNEFPWEILEKNGFGCWTAPSQLTQNIQIDEEQAKIWLHHIGYRLGEFQHQITAFQRHFLRQTVSGHLDQATYQRLLEIAEEMVALVKNSS